MRTISGFARNGGSATLAYIKNTATTNVSKSKEGSWWRLQGHVRLATKQMSTPHRCHAGEDRGNSKLWGSVSMTTRPSRRSPHCSFREEKEAKRHFRGKGRWRGERVAAGDPLLLVSTTPPLFFCPYFVCVPYAAFFAALFSRLLPRKGTQKRDKFRRSPKSNEETKSAYRRVQRWGRSKGLRRIS